VNQTVVMHVSRSFCLVEVFNSVTSLLCTEQCEHNSAYFQVSKIGVFSCGPRPLTKSIMSACEEVNKGRKLPYFIHHFENFG
jgi:hypothetical protein